MRRNVMTSKKVWDEIKDKDIDVFAMTAKVSDFCEYMDIDPNKCYIKCKATATLPALETALGAGFQCTAVEKYILVEKIEAKKF
jgi:hypothetical protein